ncbi:PEGA domain-containing protein [Haliangium sp.]|uniref:PEGA domain-containing protein n=1 Tax=Haliangium sp. TaxID=2663208 RepID=UPI003D10B8AE
MPSAATKDAMLRYHLAVVTDDKRLRREIKRVTTATNATAEFLDGPGDLGSIADIDLAIVDARAQAPASAALGSLPRDATISYIVEGDALFERIGLLADERVDSILAREDELDDDEFVASATKSLRHDIYGLHKYFPWGVTTFTLTVSNYPEKTEAVEMILAYASKAGMRGPVRERIQLAADELMMNALYHAPVDERGQEMFRDRPRKDLARLPEVPSIEVQYGCSGRYFGISVRDRFGSLSRHKILDYLSRVTQGVGADIEAKTTGAGLGLVSIAQSVSKLIFNIEPGVATEVIALFDIDLIARGKVGARSVHMFVLPAGAGMASPSAPGEQLSGSHEALRPPPALPGIPWLMVMLLAAIATAMVVALMFTRAGSSAPAEAATLSVRTNPADAEVTVNGTNINGDGATHLPSAATYEVEVEHAGHRSWRTTLSADDVRSNLRLYVNLIPEH